MALRICYNISLISWVNKRPMGHIAHLRTSSNQWNSIHLSGVMIILWNWPSSSGGEDHYISRMYFCNFVIISQCGLSIWTNLNPLYPRMLLPSLVENGHWYYRRRFLNFVNVFSLLRNYLTLEKGGVLHLNKLIYPSSKASYQLKVSDLPLQNEESFI